MDNDCNPNRNDAENCPQHEENNDEIPGPDNLRHHVAKFLICAKEKGRITQTALNMVKDSTKNLLDEYFDIVKKSLLAKIQNDVGEQFEFSQDIDQLFDVDKVFEGLNTEYQQECYYKENFNLVVRKYKNVNRLGWGWL